MDNSFIDAIYDVKKKCEFILYEDNIFLYLVFWQNHISNILIGVSLSS